MWGLDLQEETAQQADQKLVFLRSCCTIGAQYLEGQECYDILWLITVDQIGIQHIALLLWDIESSRYECQLIITLAANRFSNVMMTHLLSFSQHIPRKTSEWETQQREYDSCLAVHWNHLKVHGLRHHETRFAQKRDEAGERALKVSGRGSPEWPQVLSFSMFLPIDYVTTPTSQQLQIAAGLDGSRGKGARVLWSKAFWPGGRSNCNSLQACRGWAAFQVHLQQLEEEASQAHRSMGMWGLQLQPVAASCSLFLDLGNISMSFWFFLDLFGTCSMPLCSGHLSISFIFSILCGQDSFMFFFSCSLFFLMSLFIGGFRHRQTQTQPAWPKLVTGALPPFNPNVWSWRTVLPRPDHMWWKQGIKWHQETHLDGNHALVSFVCKNNLTNKKWWTESLPSWSMDNQKLVADYPLLSLWMSCEGETCLKRIDPSYEEQALKCIEIY